MVLDELQQFYKTSRPTKGSKHGTTDDPYAAVRSILNTENPSWAGDRGPKSVPPGTGAAPPWGVGDYAKSPQGVGAVATDSLMPYAEKTLDEHGYSPKAFALIRNKYNEGKGGRKQKKGVQKMELSKDVNLQKISPDLARFLASAAGWAMSDDAVRSGGGVPRGQMDSNVEWERAIRQADSREEERRLRRERDEERRRTAAERRRYEQSMRSAMRTRKSMDDYPEFNKIHEFWSEKSDEYHRNRPIKNGLELVKNVFVNLIKDHAPVPPRQGLIWDAVKHRWVRPENHGHSVAEVQGGKRIRGVGTGVHERSVGGHGTGPSRFTEAGRRFRGITDTGVIRPHERKHPATRNVKSTKSRGKGKMKRAIGHTRTG